MKNYNLKLWISVIIIMVYTNNYVTAQTVVHTNTFGNDMFNVASVATGDGGDGYVAIPFQDRFYYMNHHQRPGLGQYDAKFVCHEKDVNSTSCSSFGGTQIIPNQVYSIPLPDGDPAPAGSPAQQLISSTAEANEEYAIIGNRYLYYPVTRYNQNNYNSTIAALDWGAGCFDMTTNTECGYFQLSSNPNNRSYFSAVEGPFAIGQNLYFLDLESVVHCVTANSSTGAMTPCIGISSLDLFSNSQTLLPKYPSDAAFGRIGGEVVNDQLFLTIVMANNRNTPAGSNIATGGTKKLVVCIDTLGATTMMPCNSWSAAGFVQDFNSYENRQTNISNFLYYDNLMNPIAICNRGGSSGQSCVKLSNGQDENTLPDVLNGAVVSSGVGREVTYGTKTYFPQWLQSTLHCFDWSIAASCGAPFPWNSNGAPLASSNPMDYTLNIDNSNCIWALGDRNQLYSLSPITNTAPCNTGSLADMASVQCDMANWYELNVNNITTSDYVSLTIEILDNTSTWNSYDLLANSTVNLQGANYTSLTQLNYKVVAQYSTGVNSFTTPPPVLTISADESPCESGGSGEGSIVKICKIAGEGVEVGTPFTFGSTWGDTSQAQQSNLVSTTVPAGPAPGGYCAIALTDLNSDEEVIVGELAKVGYSVVDIATAGAGVATDVNVPDRYVQFDQIGAGVTEVTFTNERRFGYIEICKFSDSLTTGNYKFTINPSADVATVTVPVNGCSKPIEVPAGNITVAEVGLPPSVSMTDCGAWPSANLVNCNLSANEMTAIVQPGGIGDQTLFGFANEKGKGDISSKRVGGNYALFEKNFASGRRDSAESGALKICKESGPGVNQGDVFTFDVDIETEENHSNVEVAAGACAIVEVNIDPGSSVSISETNLVGYGVIDIDVQGNGTDVEIDLDDGIVDIGQINAGVTEVTFTNENRFGYVEICKQGTASGDFTFNISHQVTGQLITSTTVPSGACSPAIEVPSGILEIKEMANANTLLQTCTALPAAAQLGCDTINRISTIQVQPGNIANQTIAIFKNCRTKRYGGRDICIAIDDGVISDPVIDVPIGVSRKAAINLPTDKLSSTTVSLPLRAGEQPTPIIYEPGQRAPNDKEAEGLNAKMLNQLK